MNSYNSKSKTLMINFPDEKIATYFKAYLDSEGADGFYEYLKYWEEKNIKLEFDYFNDDVIDVKEIEK